MFSCYAATLCFCDGKKIQVRYTCLKEKFLIICRPELSSLNKNIEIEIRTFKN